MINKNEFIPWSDNWCIENDRAWCVDGEKNYFYDIDLITKEFIAVKEVPEAATSKWRLNPCCIKYEDYIFCMPDRGCSIWIYQLKSLCFQQIEIPNPDEVRISIRDFWIVGEKIFAVSNGLKQVIEINIAEKKIDNYYSLNCITEVEKSIIVGTIIYSICAGVNAVYQFDINTKSILKHDFPNVQSGFGTICFDGKNFWLSGYRKEIYVWNKEKNTVITLDDFPKDFGVYNFDEKSKDVLDYEAVEYENSAFLYSIVVGEYIWLIPFETNKILFVNKQTYKLNVFEVDEEIETKNSIIDIHYCLPGHKYLLEYIRDDRYLGLFSVKKDCVLEIDARKLKYQWHDYYLSKKCLRQYTKINYNMNFERNLWDRKVYEMMIRRSNDNEHDICMDNIGAKIYAELS